MKSPPCIPPAWALREIYSVPEFSDFLQRLHMQWLVEQAAVHSTATGPQAVCDICHLSSSPPTEDMLSSTISSGTGCLLEEVRSLSLRHLSPGTSWSYSNYCIMRDPCGCSGFHTKSLPQYVSGTQTYCVP